jgi:hypothetical protein
VISASLATIVAALWVAALGVDVRSTADCPSAEEVSKRLIPFLPPFTGRANARDIAQIQVLEIQGDGTAELWLRLQRADASEIGSRRVSLQGSCAEMAEAVATILATWKTDPKPESTVAQEPMTVVEGNASSGSIPRPAASFEYLLGAGAGAAMVGGIAATGSLEVLVGRPTSRWQLRLSVAAETSRQSDLAPPGQVDWQHTDAAMGLSWRLPSPRWLLSWDAGPLAGWVTMSGQGFTPGRQKRSFEYGGTSGFRLGRRIGRWSVWAEARVAFWIQGHRATLTGSTAVRDLPLVDATASLGVSMALFP